MAVMSSGLNFSGYSYQDYLNSVAAKLGAGQGVDNFWDFSKGRNPGATQEGYIQELANLGLLNAALKEREGNPVAGSSSSSSSSAGTGFNDLVGLLKGFTKDYTRSQAMADAKALMQENLRASLEANRPTIQRSVEAAGTSGGAMAGLLSTKLSTDAASKAAAAGTETTSRYGQILASILGSIAGMGTAGDPAAKLASAEKQTAMGANAQLGSAFIGLMGQKERVAAEERMATERNALGREELAAKGDISALSNLTQLAGAQLQKEAAVEASQLRRNTGWSNGYSANVGAGVGTIASTAGAYDPGPVQTTNIGQPGYLNITKKAVDGTVTDLTQGIVQNWGNRGY
jgi:hypothetical protein